jgi:tripartite-type tricarboxylate transporter receptor subunit TctC
MKMLLILAALLWPIHPVKLIVPVAAGNSVDIIARYFANQLSEELHQKVYIENKPGASQLIGIQAAINAEPDGYTFLWGTSSIIMLPRLLAAAKYNIDDLEPVAPVVINPLVLVTQSRYKNIQEFISDMKENSRDHATLGYGSSSDLAARLMIKFLNIKSQEIPFKTAPEMNLAVATNRLAFTFSSMQSIKPLLDAGQVSVFPEMNFNLWNGIFAPKGTPEDVIIILNSVIEKITKSAEFHSYMVQFENKAMPNFSLDEFKLFVQEDYKRFGAMAVVNGWEKR